jgi:hypothetical protein
MQGFCRFSRAAAASSPHLDGEAHRSGCILHPLQRESSSQRLQTRSPPGTLIAGANYAATGTAGAHHGAPTMGVSGRCPPWRSVAAVAALPWRSAAAGAAGPVVFVPPWRDRGAITE